jgi:hypothetical protein
MHGPNAMNHVQLELPTGQNKAGRVGIAHHLNFQMAIHPQEIEKGVQRMS